MSKSNKIKKKSKIEQRLKSMSQDEIALRWQAMRPRYVLWLSFFSVAATLLFLVNRVMHFEQAIVNIINVAFQISCIFSVLFVVMTAMSLFYGRTSKTPAST